MTKYIGKLKITLKSDLISGSGYSYAGTIDSDVVYDEIGIPYIPARRIKGCLKDACKDVGVDGNKLFGEIGLNKSCPVIIDNAYINNYEDIKKEIKEQSKELNVNSQEVLEQFAHVVAQTSIDEKTGTAKESTLRYTRVVNHYNPFNQNEELSFFANVEYDDENKQALYDVARAFRHTGLNRNRGFGNIRCEIIDENECSNDEMFEIKEGDDYCRLVYALRNNQSLIISNNSASKSEDYIPGQSVLGALANKFLKTDNLKDNKQLFDDLFLRGDVKYLNVYPSFENSNRCLPTPMFVKRLKKTGDYINVISNKEKIEEETKFGNQPKAINNKYADIDFINNKILIKEPNYSITYHHRRKEDKNDQLLYSLETLDPNQYFIGEILVKDKYKDIIKKLLNEKTKLKFGKSKSAQYGECEITYCKEVNSEKSSFSQGDEIVVILNSDLVAVKDGKYLLSSQEIYDYIAKELSINYLNEFEEDEKYIYMITKLVCGYNTMWNLKKPSYTAIAAGSAFIYKLNNYLEVDETKLIGAHTHEGFGEFSIIKKDDKFEREISETVNDKDTSVNEIKHSKELISNILISKIKDGIDREALNKEDLNIEASQLGRITLMLKEAIANKDNYEDIYKDFKNRLDSIKNDSFRNNVLGYIKKNIRGKNNDFGPYTSLYKMDDLLIKIRPSADEEIKEYWPTYLLNLLTKTKYDLKGRDNK